MTSEMPEEEVLHHLMKRLDKDQMLSVVEAQNKILREIASLPLPLQALSIAMAGAVLRKSNCN